MMKKLLLVFLLVSSVLFAAPATMRLDYYHTGNSKTETFSLDRVVIEPLPWPGNPAKNVDNTNLGKYFFEVVDKATGKTEYSRGFASVYGEWETTAEAEKINRSFSESLRFPAPEKPVTVILKKRDAGNAWKEVWRYELDPKDMFIDRSKYPSPAPLLELMKNGDPAEKLDFLILGDGYTAAEAKKFEGDARRLMKLLFATTPYKERQKDFNVWGLCPPSSESGISRPSTGTYRHNPIGSAYDAFGSERYILTFDNRAFREIAAHAPYEFVEIVTNSRTYGGGGIFGLYSTVAADSAQSPYVFIHEFGHHLAGLGDEYFTSDVAYQPPTKKTEPWEPNITALLDPGHLKWKDLVDKDTPIPTPWSKDKYEENSRVYQQERHKIRTENRPESEMEALFSKEKQIDTKLLSSDKYSGKVGAFEGANYAAKGYYRPQEDCIMFTRDDVGFCKVCQKALNTVIDLYTK